MKVPFNYKSNKKTISDSCLVLVLSRLSLPRACCNTQTPYLVWSSTQLGSLQSPLKPSRELWLTTLGQTPLMLSTTCTRPTRYYYLSIFYYCQQKMILAPVVSAKMCSHCHTIYLTHHGPEKGCYLVSLDEPLSGWTKEWDPNTEEHRRAQICVLWPKPTKILQTYAVLLPAKSSPSFTLHCQKKIS